MMKDLDEKTHSLKITVGWELSLGGGDCRPQEECEAAAE